MPVRRLPIVALLLLVGGCAMFARHESSVPGRKGPGLTAAVKSLTPTDFDVLRGRQEFAVRLAQAMKLGEDGKNACVSPLSVDQALCLVLNGSQGKSFDACSKVMGLKDPRVDKFNDTQSKVLDLLAGQPDGSVHVSNSIWNVFPVRFSKDYTAEMAKEYDAEVRKLGSAGEGAMKQINDWVSDKSKGRITKLFDHLDRQALAMLVNVVTFDGEWPEPFPPAQPGTFHALTGEVEVPMLHGSGLDADAFNGKGFDAVTLPYKGGSLRMSLVLPAKGKSVGSVMKLDVLRQVIDTRSPSAVDVTFPKFKFQTQADLKGAVEAMGGGSLFGPDNDFGLMSPEMSSGVAISQFVHVVQIETDERGTRAAAATGAEATAADAGPPFEFLADRPFLFFVWERNSGAVLFLGVVNDPRA